MYTYELIGQAGVDSGLLIIGDPCYMIGFDDYKYDDCIRNVYPLQPEGSTMSPTARPVEEPFGVVFPTTDGDGVYGVYRVKDSTGRIVGVMVHFDGELV